MQNGSTKGCSKFKVRKHTNIGLFKLVNRSGLSPDLTVIKHNILLMGNFMSVALFLLYDR